MDYKTPKSTERIRLKVWSNTSFVINMQIQAITYNLINVAFKSNMMSIGLLDINNMKRYWFSLVSTSQWHKWWSCNDPVKGYQMILDSICVQYVWTSWMELYEFWGFFFINERYECCILVNNVCDFFGAKLMISQHFY